MKKSISKKVTYHIFPSCVGKDMYMKVPPFRKNEEGNGKFVLNNELTQQEMKYILEQGCDNVIYKTEG